jgi:hypothetical protein
MIQGHYNYRHHHRLLQHLKLQHLGHKLVKYLLLLLLHFLNKILYLQLLLHLHHHRHRHYNLLLRHLHFLEVD